MLPAIIELCDFQIGRIESAIDKVMPILATRIPYPAETPLKVGVDFP
jgi:hypothetical protein